jgi:hypothetical protein
MLGLPGEQQQGSACSARRASSLGVNGRRPASIRFPSNARTAGTTVFVSRTHIPATKNPAIPMDRISLMGTVSSARNPMPTVDAEIASVWPAWRAAMTEATDGEFPDESASRKRLTISSA